MDQTIRRRPVTNLTRFLIFDLDQPTATTGTADENVRRHLIRSAEVTAVKKRILRRFPRLNSAYRAWRETRNTFRTPVVTPQSFRFIGPDSMQTGRFEPEETAVFLDLLSDADVVINIGANIGYYCCLALKAQKSVVAFEPVPSNLTMLMRNVEINGWQDDIEIYPVALGAEPGIAKIYGAGTGASLLEGWAGADSADYRFVPVSTLDLMIGSRFTGKSCLIVVDVEGFELDVLKGADGILKMQPSPTWMIEVAVDEHQPRGTSINPNLCATFDLLASTNYSATTANAARRAVDSDEIQAVAETETNTLGTHSFVFQTSRPQLEFMSAGKAA